MDWLKTLSRNDKMVSPYMPQTRSMRGWQSSEPQQKQTDFNRLHTDRTPTQIDKSS